MRNSTSRPTSCAKWARPSRSRPTRRASTSAWDLRTDFEKVCAEVPGLVYRDGRSGAVIGHHRGTPSYREQFGGSYWGIHRADLQAVLSKAVGLERIKLSHRLVDLTQHPGSRQSGFR